MTTLRIDGVSKRFGAVVSVRPSSVVFAPGRLHAVIGENGAGKSTLLKMAAGILAPDTGAVSIDGAPLTPHTAAEAIARGVAMVAQHFALIPVFTALENIELGAERVRGRGPFARLDHAAARSKAEEVARELGVPIPLDTKVAELSVGDRQRVEIVRTLFRDARVVILDEPTAVLTPGEADALYAVLRRLTAAGRAIVVVTHKLGEVQRFADDVTVMRRGEVLFTRPLDRTAPHDVEERALAEAIMGTSPRGAPSTSAGATTRGAICLEVRDVHAGRTLQGVTLAVYAGEVVGVAGIEGNGQHELARVLAGLSVADRGSVTVNGAALAPPRAHETRSIAVVHGDRHAEGLVLDASVAENLVLGELSAFARGGIVDNAAVAREVAARMGHAEIVPADASIAARALSGGNQQKIVVARAVAAVRREHGARVLVLSHPTRGVDIRSAAAIHDEIRALRAQGAAVLVVSSDLHELREVSDRILVIAQGRIVAELAVDAADEAFGRAMLGGASSSERPSPSPSAHESPS